MSYFAKLDDNNVVIENIVAEQDFVDSLNDDHTYIQYDKKSTGKENTATIGSTWDASNSGFIPIKPFESWSWNSTDWVWEAPTPIPEPSEDSFYIWNEDNSTWDSVSIGE